MKVLCIIAATYLFLGCRTNGAAYRGSANLCELTAMGVQTFKLTRADSISGSRTDDMLLLNETGCSTEKIALAGNWYTPIAAASSECTFRSKRTSL